MRAKTDLPAKILRQKAKKGADGKIGKPSHAFDLFWRK
jgi:hypothetical protein